ncbi:MAG: Asp-tRNA(Asn)/Glu-tRNA(Gln) amidotransferase subunit GatB [Firmicutes bacterium]|jgi:aspartyl-tRNA(Asn)/glutamyl-tRNA(Gln) amidotransferase subunit B|nr:Asp-tRNA(Asn)/Glu-tRNA(Gln) amidotransferase subunit GatB [Bacillota bacterium]HPU00979.1 Asp-tRNA(Asn)/Glu-tRNA(Gln) amidotransferase subunit GatB [Bacillota bacterium]
MKYEAVIGLEIHVELQTRSKIFCGCSTAFGAEPNTNCCPICLGLPGTLPVLNRRAVEYAVKAALALNCQVQEKSVFARKNYFYPDLTKAYQISQERMPLAWGGYLEVDFPTGSRRIHLQRVHLEEEAGKLVHAGDSILSAAYSLADYNRAGLPLLEIVTAPELHSGQEARLFLEELRLLLLYTGVSDVKMEEGSLRCDANISLRPAGSTGLGVRAEVKNLNSFRAVEQALNYEFERQARILAEGGELFQATCHWDDSRKATVVMRRKEEAADYRYFPEPDLPPLVLERSFIEAIREQLPELPRERRRRLQEQYGLSAEEAAMLVEARELADFFEAVAESYRDYRSLANWVQGDLVYRLRESGKSAAELSPAMLVELLELLDAGEISRPVAKELLAEMVKSGVSPKKLVQQRGLGRISDRETLLPLVEQVIAENPDAVENYRKGKEKALAFLVGKVMALTRGRADPQELNRLFREKL